MTALYRSIGARLLWMIRLAILVSLASYPLSGAVGAMHGPDGISVSDTVTAPTNLQPVATLSHDHGGDEVDSHQGSGKASQQDCCQDFCISMALPLAHDALGQPRMPSIRSFFDDSKAIGQISSLYRPPSA